MRISKYISTLFFCTYTIVAVNAAEPVITFKKSDSTAVLYEPNRGLSILFSENTDQGVQRAVRDLQTDIQKVTGALPELNNTTAGKPSSTIIIGTVGTRSIIDELIKRNKLDKSELYAKREKYIMQYVLNPLDGIAEALVIAGSDKRGTIYGIYELSAQMGVSPWYYWADAPVREQTHLYLKKGISTDGEPAVKYRGIFLNDEAPALAGWASERFGGFNSRFYEHVFELILRLKGNFLWPAMWGSAFYDDDARNGYLADEMGVVIGTSHHEPLGRAHDEWRRYGSGAWDYTKNAQALTQFWTGGMERIKNYETVVTVGMRGDGDEAMGKETNIALLEKIIGEQRTIIANVTGRKAAETPQVWALYKEVQDYYDQGMRVPDDVTLLLCDDNWGNVRKLPDLNAKHRKGGYGMYYHFDYVGAPRNAKWINISPISRIREQLDLTYRHGVKELWVVNVGDLKPMEYPIQFFMDMAWDPDRFNETNTVRHTEVFCTKLFGQAYAKEAARIINTYSKYNRRVTPELLNEETYSLHHYNEFETVKNDYKELLLDALKVYYLLPPEAKDTYDQLVLFPVSACANLYEMYYAVAKNKDAAAKNDPEANQWADLANACFIRDSLLTIHYHTGIANGKWNRMMSQTHIGYTSWQQPTYNIMPDVKYVTPNRAVAPAPVFLEQDGYISIEAPDFTRRQAGNASWIIVPDMGRTLGAVTTTPVTIQPNNNTYLEYDIVFASEGTAKIELYLSPTLNYNGNRGLRYALSLAEGEEQVVNFNAHYRGELGQWQAEAIIKSSTEHHVPAAGKHTCRFRALDPGIVLQKIVIDMGGLQPAYLGPPASPFQTDKENE